MLKCVSPGLCAYKASPGLCAFKATPGLYAYKAESCGCYDPQNTGVEAANSDTTLPLLLSLES